MLTHQDSILRQAHREREREGERERYEADTWALGPT